jgi:(2Fe-2S) ferredoxin
MLSLTDKSGSVYRYGKLDKKKVRRIVAEHVLRGVVVEEYLCKA